MSNEFPDDWCKRCYLCYYYRPIKFTKKEDSIKGKCIYNGVLFAETVFADDSCTHWKFDENMDKSKHRN